jgi:hypothetical protein
MKSNWSRFIPPVVGYWCTSDALLAAGAKSLFQQNEAASKQDTIVHMALAERKDID